MITIGLQINIPIISHKRCLINICWVDLESCMKSLTLWCPLRGNIFMVSKVSKGWCSLPWREQPHPEASSAVTAQQVLYLRLGHISLACFCNQASYPNLCFLLTFLWCGGWAAAAEPARMLTVSQMSVLQGWCSLLGPSGPLQGLLPTQPVATLSETLLFSGSHLLVLWVTAADIATGQRTAVGPNTHAEAEQWHEWRRKHKNSCMPEKDYAGLPTEFLLSTVVIGIYSLQSLLGPGATCNWTGQLIYYYYFLMS